MSSDESMLQQDQGPELLIISSIFATLATLAVVGRFAARKLRKLAWAADDWAVVIALVLKLPGQVSCKIG